MCIQSIRASIVGGSARVSAHNVGETGAATGGNDNG
jgi:hypothetical protein